MSEYWQVEKTVRPDGSCERFEIHIGGIIHVISLERGKALAQGILSLLGIEVAHLEAERDAFKWFIRQIPLRQFAEIVEDVPEEYRRVFILTAEEFESLGGER